MLGAVRLEVLLEVQYVHSCHSHALIVNCALRFVKFQFPEARMLRLRLLVASVEWLNRVAGFFLRIGRRLAKQASKEIGEAEQRIALNQRR